MKPIPEVGKEYNYFDDGKIRLDRRDTVTITEIIPFNDASETMKREWEKETSACDWLFAPTTDYFIKAVLEINGIELIFVRTIDGGWFSYSDKMWDGRLDVDGELYRFALNRFSTIKQREIKYNGCEAYSLP